MPRSLQISNGREWIECTGQGVQGLVVTTESLAGSEQEDLNAFLTAGAGLFAAGSETSTILEGLTALVVPRMADYATIHVVQSDGSIQQVAAAHVDGAKRRFLEELGRVHRPSIHGPGVLARAITRHQPVVCRRLPSERMARVPRDPALRQLQASLAPHSYAIVPINRNGTVNGAFCLVMSDSGRSCRSEHIHTLQRLAVPIALAIENSHLREADEHARELAVQLTDARLRALRAQLRPHFLFNALNTIAMLVRRDANAAALDAIVALSELLRRALVFDAAPEVPLSEEIAAVELYLNVERLRFRDQLRVDIDIPDALGAARLPSLILQPIVENAVLHSMAERTGAVRVRIRASKVEGMLRLDVEDNGPGFPEGWELASASGRGLQNVNARLEALHGTRRRFEISRVPGGGSRVRIELPFCTSPSRPMSEVRRP